MRIRDLCALGGVLIVAAVALPLRASASHGECVEHGEVAQVCYSISTGEFIPLPYVVVDGYATTPAGRVTWYELVAYPGPLPVTYGEHEISSPAGTASHSYQLFGGHHFFTSIDGTCRDVYVHALSGYDYEEYEC